MSLRDRLSEPRILAALGSHDALTARIAEREGVEALYHGGYAAAAHHHGLPDIGLVGMAEMVESARRVASGAPATPMIVDADSGYGGGANVTLAVRQFEAAGAAAIQLEDQEYPKRCGHMADKRVVPAAEMAGKIRAAVQARRDPETVIIARTDALQVHGLDDAIERCNLYAEAGADVAFVDAPRTREEIAEIAQRVQVASLANMSETGRTPLLTAAELEAMGYKIVIFPSTQTWIFARAYAELAQELVQTGTTTGLADRMVPFDELNELLDLAGWRATDVV
jgi:2-methylisocitrate lyase-like PEP mutase family enzyme